MVRKVTKSYGFGWLAIIALLTVGLLLRGNIFLRYLGIVVGGAIAGWAIKAGRPSERVHFALWMAAAALAGSSSSDMGFWIPWSVFAVCLVLERMLLGLLP